MDNPARRFKFPKTERLRGHTLVASLFKSRNQAFQFPFKVYWSRKEQEGVFNLQIIVTVPKSYSKKAVDRNLIRRRIKEAYRLNKHILFEDEALQKANFSAQMVIIYVAKEPLAYLFLEKRLKSTLLQLRSLLLK